MGTQVDNTESGQHHAITVYPAGEGDPVAYQRCEIEEVDREGVLRIARKRGDTAVGDDPEAGDSTVYVVWAPGSWQRAEETLSAACPAS